MLIHLGAAFGLHSPHGGPQPVHSSYSTPTDPLLLPFPGQDSTPSLRQHNQHFHPSQGKQQGFGRSPALPSCLSPQAAGRHSPASAFPSPRLLWSPGLFLQSPCPRNVFVADHLRAWHFPCPDDLLSVGSPPKAQLGTPLHTFCSV